MKIEARDRHPLKVGLRHSSRLLRSRDSGLVLTILAITIGLVIVSPGFRTSENLLNTLDQWAPIGVISCAMTIALICRGLDLSAGAIYVFSGLICAKATIATDSVWMGVAAACLVGTGIGALNAFLIVKVEINAFIATLATSVIVGGLTLAIAKGYLVTVDTPGFETIGTGQLLGINISVWIFAAFAMILWFFLRNTRFGRHLYATGGAEEAARLAGVPVARIKATTYVLLGFSAALAGVIIVSRTLTAQTDSVSYGVLFQIFTAVIVGGTAIHGGEGGIGRTTLGLALLAVVTNGFIFLNVPATLQQVLLGCILLVAIGYDAYLKSHEQDTTDHDSQMKLQPEEHHA